VNTLQKLIAAAVIGGLSTAALAATMPTKESVEKAALAAHTGTILSSAHETKNGKDVWQVLVRGTDGKTYTMYFDAKTGAEVKV
jgi:uncharacterized membrane protein YkoI